MEKSTKRGFTILELMIVVAIISIIAALLVPKALGATNSAKIVGIEYNAELLNSTVTARYTTLYNKVGTEEEILDIIYADINTNPEFTEMKNPYNKNMIGVGLIKGATFVDSNKAAYIFTDIPDKATIPIGVVYTVVKNQQIASSYSGSLTDIKMKSILPVIFGGVIPGDITDVPGGGWDTDNSGGGGSTITPTPPSTGTPSTGGITDDTIDRYFAKQLALQLSDFATYKGDWAATASTAGATGLVFANYIGTAFEPYKNLATIEDVYSSTGAMDLVANSSMAVDAIIASTAAQNALVLSSTASNKIVASSLAIDKVASNGILIGKIAKSAISMKELVENAYSINKLTLEGTGGGTYAAIDMFLNSEIAMEYIANSPTAMSMIAKNIYFVSRVSSTVSTMALDKLIASSIAMEAIINSGASVYYLFNTDANTTKWFSRIAISRPALGVLFNSPIIAERAISTSTTYQYLYNSPLAVTELITSNISAPIVLNSSSYTIYMISNKTALATILGSDILLNKIRDTSNGISTIMGTSSALTTIASTPEYIDKVVSTDYLFKELTMTTLNMSSTLYKNLMLRLTTDPQTLIKLMNLKAVGAGMGYGLTYYRTEILSTLADTTYFAKEINFRIGNGTSQVYHGINTASIYVPISCSDDGDTDMYVYNIGPDGLYAGIQAGMASHGGTATMTSGVTLGGVFVKGVGSSVGYITFDIYTLK